ncbi:tRNA (adenine(22)-N(1))-methyltransferase [Clostridium thermarum]|uniref:tRNA (adenine(22)-N(1))-methyltransferase n=1 Tax=Clostridium thermarum TaxID=1716543 RepID=UPI0013D7140F|nr:class I SAM-dependent methyltransferase [Clostridium thermarum]
MNISDRLMKIANMVHRCNSMADIGTDHGYIPIFLVKKGICDTAIASDINKGPVLKAEKNVKLYGLQDKIQCRLGGGLKTIVPGEVDTAVIAGMGGHLIVSILEESAEVAQKMQALILQPVQHVEILRKYLYENGYEILSEDLCFDEGKYYEIIKARYDGKKRTLEDIYYEISPFLMKKRHPLLQEYILHKINKNNIIVENINEDTEAASRRKEDLIRHNLKLKGIMACL